ncbi:MAG: DsbA family protein [Hyphomicrobium sp.]
MPSNEKTQRVSPSATKRGFGALKIAGCAALLGVGAMLFSVMSREAIEPARAADAFNDDQKAAIGAIVKDYLLKNPEVILEIQSALEAKMEKEQADKLKAFMAENAKSIYRSPNASVAGNPDGDITVVEFFDYNCGYCKRGMPEIRKLIEKDNRVRVVFKELPILSKGSDEAAHAALAAKRQGKYWEFHQAMLSNKGQANEASALKVAQSLGLDMDKFKADMASKEVADEVDQMKALARKMGISGTPHFLVGDKSIPGAPEDLHTQLESLVADFRKSGCGYC